MTHQPFLVVGANGKTGRRVAARPRDRDAPVRAASRSGDQRFDWADEGTGPCGKPQESPATG